MRRRFLQAIIIAVILTSIAALPAGWNPVYRSDNAVSDALYQKTGGYNKDIIVFGIDQETIDELGPAASLRSAVAQAIENLNSEAADRPAVIGIDIMFTGNNKDAPDADRFLADTAGRYDNIVVAADAKFGNRVVMTEENGISVQTDGVLGWYEPYDALRGAVSLGHVNQSYDSDGIFRHARLFVDTPENGRIYSFGKVIYDKWCEKTGLEPGPMPETTQSGYYYLPFSNGEDGYSDGFNFLDLYEGKVDPYYFRNKIVLIGPTASGMQDEYVTSLDHSRKISGVNIQANMIEAFMTGTNPVEASKALQLAILFLTVWGLAVFLWNRRVILSAAVWLAVCAAWIGICRIAYHNAFVLHALWIPAGATVVLAVSVAFNYIRSQKEKKKVTDTFGHYIDPVIRDQLLAKGPEGLELGGETREVAVLFVDVRGFTAMSEEMDAQTVVEILNRYLTLMTDCIMKNHGTLDKFVGDCAMAIWNAPVDQKDAVYLACRAAMDMVDGAKTLGEELMQRFGRSVSFGIGIHYGSAVVGNIGAPKRLDYTAIGDTVNTAARLEANAAGGTILISRAVADALGERAAVTTFGEGIKLKGKAEAFEVLRLDGLETEIGK